MIGADAIIKCLEAEGVSTVFGYPGVAICPFFNSILDSDIKTVLIRTEQNAAHAASGVARMTGRPGVCAVTSGPGATNVITGIATAFADSIPMICITGQVNSELLGSDVFQEADITGAVESFVKYSYGLKGTVRLLRIPLDAVDAARVKVSAQISQIVERIGMGPDLYQAGVCHLPAHIPAEEVVSGHVLHIHHNRDHGFHLVCLKQREEQLVVAPVSVVKGDEKGFFRQRLSPCQLPRQHSVVAMFRQPAQVLFHTAHGDGHIVARLTVLHDMVVHQHREGPVRRNGHLPHSPGIEIDGSRREAERRCGGHSQDSHPNFFHLSVISHVLALRRIPLENSQILFYQIKLKCQFIK